MIHKRLVLFLILLSSCASQQGRRPVYDSEVPLKGGRFAEKEWDDKLSFKRVSWYQDATLSYDLLIAELKESSPFINWLGSNKLKLNQCSHFYITFLYASPTMSNGLYHLRQELMNNELEEVSVVDFAAEVKANRIIQDRNLWEYKVVGWCSKDDSESPKINVRNSGYKDYPLFL